MTSKVDNGFGALVVYKQQYSKGYVVTRPKLKKKNSYSEVFPSGVDDGHGAQRLLHTYVDESLAAKIKKPHVIIPLETISSEFKNMSFLDQVNHLEMKNLPLLSQVAKQKALLPHHSTEKKKRLIDIAQRLKRNDSALVHVRLNNESIDDVVLNQITLGLSRNTYLQHLMLHNNAITDEGVHLLCMALRWHPTFHCLWLGANKVTDIGAKTISTLLHRNPRIKELNLSNKWPSKVWARNQYDLHPHITYIGADYFAQQLASGCGLTSLSLADQRVRDDGATSLFNTLIYCELRSLNLSGNELTDRCCSSLGAALTNNPVLEMLTLSHNSIGDSGAAAIADGLSHNTFLNAIDLGHNSVNCSGLEALYLCLDSNTTLTALITINNAVNDDRAENKAGLRANVFGGFRGALVAASNHPHRSHHYHGGHQFLSEEETKLLTIANTAEKEAGGQLVLAAVREGDDLSVVEYGSVVDTASLADNKHSNQLVVAHDNSHNKSGDNAVVPAIAHSHHRPPSPWSVPLRNSSPYSSDIAVPGVGILGESPLSSAYRTERQSSADKSAAVVANKTITSSPSKPPAIGSLTQTSLSASYRDLFAAGVAGGTGSRPSSHESKSKRVSLSPSNRSFHSDHDLADDHSAGGTPLKRKPSFIRTLSNLSAAASSSAHSRASSADNSADSSQSKPHSAANNSHSNKPHGRKKKLIRRSSFYGPDRETTPNFPSEKDLEQTNKPRFRPKPSKLLGKTVGVPDIKNIGVMPVRTSISTDKDSAQHFIYLRISTGADHPNERPTSLMQIARDREEEIRKMKEFRQSAQYKADKKFSLSMAAKMETQKSAEPRVPDRFWVDWSKKIRLQYNKGVDNAKGVTSTRLEPIPHSVIRSQAAQARSDDLLQRRKEQEEERQAKEDKDKVSNLARHGITRTSILDAPPVFPSVHSAGVHSNRGSSNSPTGRGVGRNSVLHAIQAAESLVNSMGSRSSVQIGHSHGFNGLNSTRSSVQFSHTGLSSTRSSMQFSAAHGHTPHSKNSVGRASMLQSSDPHSTGGPQHKTRSSQLFTRRSIMAAQDLPSADDKPVANPQKRSYVSTHLPSQGTDSRASMLIATFGHLNETPQQKAQRASAMRTSHMYHTHHLDAVDGGSGSRGNSRQNHSRGGVGRSSVIGGAGRRSASPELTAAQHERKKQSEERTMTAYEEAAYSAFVKQHPELSYQKHLGGKKSAASPGQILAARRKENAIQREAKRLREQSAVSDGDEAK